jgi:hypothetical protein
VSRRSGALAFPGRLELRNQSGLLAYSAKEPAIWRIILRDGSLHAGEFRSAIMALDAQQIVGAYRALGRDSLFSLNIRNFVGNTATNKKIVETARSNPERFFLFNNGISCICSSLHVAEDKIEVEGLQVINGAQTVKALVNASRTRGGEVSPWSSLTPTILVRITEIPGGHGQSQKLRDQVTQFNNTQNVVKVSDFRSNDTVQEHLTRRSFIVGDR